MLTAFFYKTSSNSMKPCACKITNTFLSKSSQNMLDLMTQDLYNAWVNNNIHYKNGTKHKPEGAAILAKL